ncbi:MrcB family domain-containing protein [Alicyclobacillus sp. TC]|uniref:MrcB family domain-containing protein n=1 Tax=Alicyclobacillus sp. TC TaxID=2606450 RepID=UPI001933BB39|nr:DUF3578 domain-containing protein [Alicyclobacillus sp. TC]
MSVQDTIHSIMHRFLPVRNLSDEDRLVLKRLVEVDLVNDIRTILIDQNLYTIKGRVGQARWADVPWIGIHDRRIDSAATTGVYVALLFKVDGSGFALSIQMGTEGLSYKQIKMRSAQQHRFFSPLWDDFSQSPLSLRPQPVDLRTFPTTSRPAKYEVANLVGKEYHKIDSLGSIENDISRIICMYNDWVGTLLGSDDESAYQEALEPVATTDIYINERPPDRLERTYVKVGSLHPQRDPKQGAIAERICQYRCEGNENHETFLRENGIPYLEKHHLIPMERYFETSIDHFVNIYCLCPLCHRAIHHAHKAERKSLIEKLFNARQKTYKEFYGVDLNDLLKFYNI